MKITDRNNLTQREALLNECKGNLFEFLVAQNLSRHYGREDSFLLGLSRDFRNRLRIYEETIRAADETLLLALPVLARSVSADLLKQPMFADNTNSFEFMVIGKMVAVNDNETWNETDIVALEQLSLDHSKKHFLSLKLTKDHSYTNTKSAGVKSFITKYFSAFPKAGLYQQLLNQEVDESFNSMGHALYEEEDLEWKGSFVQHWPHSELPGELPDNLRKIVHQNYYRVASRLYSFLAEMNETNSLLFKTSLEALCGFGHQDILQVHCFHKEAQLKNIVIKTYHDFFKQDEAIVLTAPGPDSSSFDVQFSKFQLQIRVKPMNKFTTAAYKINCSIKMAQDKTDTGNNNE